MNSFYSEHGTKILGALTAVLGTLASLIAAGAFKELLTPTAIGWLNIFVSLSTAGVGGATMARGFNNSAQAKVASAMETAIKATPGQSGFARPLALALLLAVAVPITVLSGCASLGASSATEKLIVQAATMKFIESSDDRAAKASRIVKAAAQARVWLDTDGVTVADLQAAMVERIAAADLEPSDKLLASALVEVVVAELNVRIGEGVISADKRATVNAVLAWVEQAASFYTG